jgi:hypothetical protein
MMSALPNKANADCSHFRYFNSSPDVIRLTVVLYRSLPPPMPRSTSISTTTATSTAATSPNRISVPHSRNGVSWRPECVRPRTLRTAVQICLKMHHLVTTIPLSRRSLSAMQFLPSPNDLSRNRSP